MLLKRLKLKNFCSILDSEIYFDNNINLITGDNGQGKSYVMIAISMLLYNEFKGKLEDYINWSKDNFELELDFINDNIDCKLTMYYDRKTSEKHLYIKDDYYKNSDANKKLEEILNKDLSVESSLCFQGNEDIVNCKPAKRREFLKSIYDLNFEKGIKNIDLEIKDLENNKLVDLKNKLYLLENKKYNFENLLTYPFDSKEKVLYESKIDLLNKTINNVEILKSEFNNKFLQLKEIENNITNYNSKLDNYNSNKIQLENELKRYNDIESNKDSLFDNVKKYENELNNLDYTILENLKNEYSSIRLDRLKVFDESILNEKNKKLSSIEFEINKLEKELKIFESGKCPTCNQKIDSVLIDNYSENIGKLQKEFTNLENEILILLKDKKEYDNKVEEQRELKNKRVLLENKINSETDRLNTYKANLLKNIEDEKKYAEIVISQNKTNIDKVNKDIDFTNKEIKDIDLGIKKLLDSKELINKDLENFNILDINSQIETCKKDIINYTELLDTYKSITIKNEKITENNTKLKLEQKEDKEVVKDLYISIDKVNEELRYLTDSKYILQKDFPNYVIKKLVENIKVYMNNFLDDTYNGRYKVDIIEKRDSIYIVYGENNSDIYMASGWEKSLFSLSWKLSLQKISKIKRPLLLDEMDSYATEENSVKFYDFIGNNLKDIQSIIITHKDNTKIYLSNNFNCKIFEVSDGKIT